MAVTKGQVRAIFKELEAGDGASFFKHVADDCRRDELGNLARDFDIMAAQIERLMSAQRRFVAELSNLLRLSFPGRVIYERTPVLTG
jgi:hypothetical protein